MPFDAFAWLLTDPDTTVGTAPLADAPCLDRSPAWWHSATPVGTPLDRRRPGVPYRPVRPGSELAQFLASYGTYDVVSIVFADRFGWWGFLDLWREGGQFEAQDFELIGLLAEPVTTALRESRAATFVMPDGDDATVPSGQAVLLLGPDLTVRRQTAQAEAGAPRPAAD